MDDIRDELAELHNSAFGWALLCCGRDPELATEVLQQAYCRILGGDACFEHKSQFSTWVFGVIRHVALEEMRRHKQQHDRFRCLDAEAAMPSTASIDGVSMEQHERAEQLGLAMKRLSVRQREVLHLTFYEDMTIDQAARLLKITVGSARQHYQRGKTALRRTLSANRELNDER